MKTTITSEELLKMLSDSQGGTRIIDLLKALDPEVTEEMFHYLQVRVGQRMKSYSELNNHCANPFTITAEVLKEEKAPSIAYVIGLYGIAHYNHGIISYRVGEHENKKNQFMDGLAEHLMTSLKKRRES